jgi:hypothetical protein
VLLFGISVGVYHVTGPGLVSEAPIQSDLMRGFLTPFRTHCLRDAKPDISGRNTPGVQKLPLDNQRLATEAAERPSGFALTLGAIPNPTNSD